MGSRLAQVVGVMLVAVAMTAAVAVAAPLAPRVRVGSVPSLPLGTASTGNAPAATRLHMTIVLKSRDPSGLAAFATEVSTPGTPLFRQYLTVPEFAQRFGATPAAVAAVGSALRAQGMRVGPVAPNNLTLSLTGTAAQVESAFSVSLAQVRTPSGLRGYANAQAPTLPENIGAYVQAVIGLDNATPPQPAGLEIRQRRSASRAVVRAPSGAQVVTGGPQPCGQASATGGVTADLIATAYQFTGFYGAGDFGQNQSVAVIEEEPYDPGDIATYQTCYGTSASVSNLDVDGGPGPYTLGTSDDSEAALDIEQVIGLAPNANILVYQGENAIQNPSAPFDILSAIVSQDRAKVISSSWGLCERLTAASVISGENMLLQEAAAQGQSFFISSGDSGSTMCYQANPYNPLRNPSPDVSLSVIDPGAQPFATGVGGTSLLSIGPPPAEDVWNDGFDELANGNERASASGGGISQVWPMPGYQSSAAGGLGVVNPNSSSTPCGSPARCREVPDVSADGDPHTGYPVFYNGRDPTQGWTVVGGTSAAAPLWAAYTALVNDLPACRGVPIGFANPALYAIAGSGYLSNFHAIGPDQSAGRINNDPFWFKTAFATDPPNGHYPVTGAYSMATGLGTPVGQALAASLCSATSPVFTVTVANPGAQRSAVGHAVSLALHASDSGGKPVSYSAAGLPAGLSINPSTGVVSGNPTTPGSTVATIGATDSVNNTGTAQFAWAVGGPPWVSGETLKGVRKARAKLSFTVSAGPNAPGLTAITVSLPRGLAFARGKKGVSVRGRHAKARIGHGRLTLTFAQPVSRVTVTIGRPAITVSSALARRVSRHRVKTVSVGVSALDATRLRTQLAFKVRPI